MGTSLREDDAAQRRKKYIKGSNLLLRRFTPHDGRTHGKSCITTILYFIFLAAAFLPLKPATKVERCRQVRKHTTATVALGAINSSTEDVIFYT
ncbi:hypothetical protein WG66_009700 [Moniliophthora roreri]|nr:hypothetical protein WG66_009700 [Moniliophthora roreri]